MRFPAIVLLLACLRLAASAEDYGYPWLQWCHNQEKPPCCKVCGECPDDATATGGDTGGGGGGDDAGGGGGGGVDMRPSGGGSSIVAGDDPRREMYTPARSFVDELGLNYYHIAVDYRVVEPGTTGSGGCASCGARPVGDDVGALERLTITRIHRARDFWIWSSLGQGVFLDEFDMKLQLVPNGYGGQPNIWLFDPRGLDHYHSIFEQWVGGDGAIDGIYHDGFATLRDVRLYDAAHHLAPDQSLAKTAELMRLNGEVYVFEVIRTTSDPGDDIRDARLIAHRDRNGNALVVTYQFAADASDADLGYDRTQLWKMATATDPHGASAAFAYGSINGRWVVTAIALPNGSSVQYGYAQDGYGGGWVGGAFRSATHADGSVSRVTTTYDAATQNLVVHYDDDAAADGRVRESVYLTMGTYTDGATVINQPAGLARRIYDGTGALKFRAWESPGDPTQIYFYRGGGKVTREGTSNFIAHVDHAVSQCICAGDQPNAGGGWDVTKRYQTAPTTQITGVTDALGRFWGHDIDASSWTDLATHYPDGTTSTTTYNSFRQPLRHVDRLGRITDCVYDAAGDLLSRTLAVGTPAQATWTWTHLPNGQVASETDANGNTTTYTYDAHGYLASVTEPGDLPGDAPSTWLYVHDAAGRLISLTDPVGRVTTYAYDARNRLTTTTYADGTTETIAYGSGPDANLVASRTDRDGNVTSYAYDEDGRVVSTTWATDKPESVTEQLTYLDGTTLIASRVRRGERVDYAYDQRQRLVGVARQPTATRVLATIKVYDVVDRLIATIDPYGRANLTLYDVVDHPSRLVEELVPGGLGALDPARAPRVATPNPPYVVTDRVVDADGEVVSITDGRAIVTSFAFDAQGRQVAKVEAAGDPASARTEWTYDAQGNCLSTRHPRHFTEPGGFITAYTYGARNLLASMTDAAGRPEQGTTSYTYTPTKKLATRTDARGNTTTYRYCDCCDRVEQLEDPLHFITAFAYDGWGSVTATIDANGNAVTRAYDGLHRLVALTNGAGETTTYAYDDDLVDGLGLDATYAARLAGLGLGAGADGSAVAVSDPLGGTTVTIRDGVDRVIRVLDPNGNAVTTGYDQLVSGTPGAAGALVATIRTDALGHATSTRADGAGRIEATIDALGKLTRLGYDADGNQVTTSDPNHVGQTCAYDTRNRRVSCTDSHGDSTGYAYDAASNRISTSDGLGATTTAIYDARQRITISTDRLARPPVSPSTRSGT